MQAVFGRQLCASWLGSGGQRGEVVEGSAEWDEWFLLGAGLELGDEFVEVGGGPGVQLGQWDWLAFLGSVIRLISRGVGSRAGGSVSWFWLTRVSLKFRHLAPYSSVPSSTGSPPVWTPGRAR